MESQIKTYGDPVVIVMGSDSDLPIMNAAVRSLRTLSVRNRVFILSAHRTPDAVCELATNARKWGVKVIIAGAGGAAHLAGIIAAQAKGVPVIGVPIHLPSNGLGGMDALLATVNMPPGVPVATMAINGAKNAAIMAAQILSLSPEHAGLVNALEAYRMGMESEVLHGKNGRLQDMGVEKFLEEVVGKK